jgi:hypothetical protein
VASSGESGQRPGDGPPPGVQVDQDMQFQRREWAVQRIGWVAGVLVLAASLAGALGHGPLSHAEAEGLDGALHVKYERIVRSNRPVDLTFSLAAGTGNETVLWLSREMMERMSVEAVRPEPVRWWATPARTGLVFAHAPDTAPGGPPGGGGGGAGATVGGQTVGGLGGEVGVEGRDGGVRVWMLALP